ncbi:hypothetical protein [Ralstonia pseudosolanacearum]|uniref:hypothetical protein n=1 Tax=Ralstonia pseudosolanacearum TaxID=1310165 RepID=UPI003CECB2C2
MSNFEIWLTTLRRRCRWATYEYFVMRPAYATDRAQMAVALGHEADDHYGEGHSVLWDSRRFIAGWLKAVFTKRLPDAFTDTWFV